MLIEVESGGAQIVFDGEMVTIRRVGAMARSVFGPGAQAVIPARRITSVEWRDPSWSRPGHIRFSVPGTQAAAAPTALNRDPHAVFFSKKQKPAFEKLRDLVQDAISQ